MSYCRLCVTVRGELVLQVKPGPKQWVRVVGWSQGTTATKLIPADPAEVGKEVEKRHAQPIKPEEQTIRSISRTSASGK